MKVRPPAPDPARRREAAGFTLIEMLVVLVLLAVLAGIAAPSFSSTLRRYRVDSVTERLTTSLAHARVEAQRQGRQITIRRVEPCAANKLPGDWRCGWTGFVDLDRDGRLDPEDTVILESDAHPTVHVRNSGLTNNEPFVQISRFGLISSPGLQVFPDGQDPLDSTVLSDNQRICLWGSRMRIVKGVASCS